MRRVLALLCACHLGLAQDDPRDVRAGWVLPDEGYCDQPLVVRLADGAWLAVLTTGAGAEGQRGQHVVAVRSRDRGRTWSPPVDIEPADGPEASWGVPLVAPSGRVFVFYVYNVDLRRDLRADMLGAYALRWSDDGGATWSARARIPVRVTAIDRENDFQGETLMHWGVSHPLVQEGALLVPFTKIGKHLVEQTEAWFLRSPDLLSIEDPAQARWELLPDGERGLRAAGPIASEPCLAALPDGALACVMRTVDGHPLLATSRDGGRSWTEPAPIEDEDGRTVRHPRACVRLWRTGPERFLLWTHEVGTPTWAPGTRNPAWVRGGRMREGTLRFGPPEILLYDPDPALRISYPDLVREDDELFVLETQKSVARTHRLDPALVEALFAGAPRSRVDTPGLRAEGRGGVRLAAAAAGAAGWTLEAWVELPADGRLPARLARAAAAGREVTLSVDRDLALSLGLRDGGRRAPHTSEPHALAPGAPRHVAVVIDLGPGVLRWFVDGRALDGGSARERGWDRLEVRAPPAPDEKLLLVNDAARDLRLDDGGQFRLGDPERANALLVPIGTAHELTARFGRVARLGMVTTGVGFQPSDDLALPASGTVRLRYADGFEQEETWDLTDSNGAGRGDAARTIGAPWTVVRTADGARWEGRHLYWQVFATNPGRELVGLVLDARGATDAEGDDAEFALLAVSTVSAHAPSGATLSPHRLDAAGLNGDVMARDARDGAGRGFRDAPRPAPVTQAALGALREAPIALGGTVLSAGVFDRPLLASEVRAIFRAGR